MIATFEHPYYSEHAASNNLSKVLGLPLLCNPKWVPHLLQVSCLAPWLTWKPDLLQQINPHCISSLATVIDWKAPLHNFDGRKQDKHGQQKALIQPHEPRNSSTVYRWTCAAVSDFMRTLPWVTHLQCPGSCFFFIMIIFVFSLKKIFLI